jgi:CRISPR-associated endonuclease/helicase Cas3
LGASERVDHSTAGAQWLVERFGTRGRLLAYGAAGHHGGMPDGFDETGGSLTARLDKTVPDWDAGVLEALDCPRDLGPLPILVSSSARSGFQVSFFTRMLFSCLVDADFLDTEEFFDRERSAQRSGYPQLSDLRLRLEAHLAELTAGAKVSTVNRARAVILAACREGSKLPPGLFSLTVPTGGGKTLASLAFALDHAQEHGLRRVIYAIPYTSIIEQTADVFRQALGDEAVLEHHSNYDPLRGDADGTPTDPTDDSTQPLACRARLASENWDAPVVVTTNVQFFESLFHNRPGRCRRLHNIADSVVILDEAQMLPVDYLLPCLEALRELSLNYGVSIVLCTATQPALGRREGFAAGLEGVRELMPDPADLARRLERVDVVREGSLGDDELAARIAAEPQVLCIVNTRGHAARLFAAVREHEGAFHLSANMCAAHRSRVLSTIRRRLKAELPCRVVSTQLVEAGVDVDFPVVYRAAAGTDSLAQAAGRCNREGRKERGQVHAFDVDTADLPPGLLRQAAEEGRAVLRQHEQPLSLTALEAYFQALYWRRENQLDKWRILDAFNEGAQELNFDFRKAAERFQLIQETGEAVIVPLDGEAQKWVEQLEWAESPRWLLRKLQRYTVNVPPATLAQLLSMGAVETRQGRYRVLTDLRFYREDLGLVPEIVVDPASLVV